MKHYYANKRAVIVGGSEGIGLALAHRLLQNGSRVILLSRDPKKQESALNLLTKTASYPEQVKAIALDVTDSAATQGQMEKICHDEGIPDFLFNCAGYAQAGYLENLSMPVLQDMMNVNYFGTVHTIKSLLPYFLKRQSGHIVNVSSLAGLFGIFGYTGYCATKYAVIGFSEALRQEVRPFGIFVSTLCPPNTQTPGLQRENLTKPKEVLEMEEKVSVASTEEIARATLRALPKKPALIVPTRDGRMAHRLGRWTPGLASWVLRRKT